MEGFKLVNSVNDFSLLIDDKIIGKCYLTHIMTSDMIEIEGLMNGPVVMGDKSITASGISFSIPNLLNLWEDMIVIETEEIKGILFENDNFRIIIKKRNQFSDLKEYLYKIGGYMLLYDGEIINKKGHISLDDLNDVLQGFSTFLSFINGRRCSPLFRKGIFEDNLLWSDYTDYLVDQYKDVNSWVSTKSTKGLNELWYKFSKLWKNKEHREFLVSVMHWYIEANMQSGFTDGAIIMAQTGLELIYNWLIVEQKKFISGADADNLSASNKIRLVLSTINLSNDVPDSLSNLKSFLGNGVTDAPEAFVQIRNAIVHSQSSKRKKLRNVSNMLKYEALQLALWYIELALLNILDYKEEYVNRCDQLVSGYRVDSYLPWSKIPD